MRNIHREKLRETLGLPDKMPPEFEARYENVPCFDQQGLFIDWFNVVVAKSKSNTAMKKSAAHRIFVECSCGVLVPTGRLSQHRCDARHRAHKIKSIMHEQED